MSNDERRFSDREVAEILRKASDTALVGGQSQAEGLSLTELKAIAVEVGIDPDRIQSAALSLVEAGGSKTNVLLGAPTEIAFEAHVPGELGPDRAAEVLAVIRRVTRLHGKVSDVHGATEWSATGDMGSRLITVSARDGHTTIQASARLGQGAIISFIPSMMAGIFTVVAMSVAISEGGNPLALVLLPLILATLFLVPRVLWSRSALKEQARMRQAVEELSRLAESTVEEA